jgi:type I restriction enzyme S subunit
MKSRWPVRKLSEVAEIQMGQSPKGTSYNTSGEGVPLINGPVEFGETPFSRTKKTKFTTEPTKLCKEGDLILCVRGSTTGRMNIAGYDSCIGRGVAAIRSKEHQDWINFFVHANRENIYKLGSGSTFPNVSGAILSKIEIPIPPIAEQKQIVAILDEAFEGIDSAIANTEKNLANARELFESYLNAIFTRKGKEWRDLTLQEISVKFSRGKSKHRPRGDQKLYGGKYPFIQTGDIGNSKHRIIDYSQTYNELGLAQSELWPKGTVCIAIVGANIAETAILGFDACFPDSVIGIVVNSDIASSDYVEYLLQFFKSEIKAKGKGTARENINMGTFANQRFPFPDLETQKAIACQLDELSFQAERLEDVYQQKLAALNELKQSILQKAFSGELTAEVGDAAGSGAREVVAA